MDRQESGRRVRLGDLELVLSPGAPGEIFEGRAATFGIVQSSLMRYLGDPFVIGQLRDAMTELDPFAARLDHVGVIAHAARQVELGRWQLERPLDEHPQLDEPTVTNLSDLLPPPDEGPTLQRSHYVEIELVGEDDGPIAGERYRVVLPNGSSVEGRTGADGTARIVGIDRAGTCKVSFPDLDQDAWQPL